MFSHRLGDSYRLLCNQDRKGLGLLPHQSFQVLRKYENRHLPGSRRQGSRDASDGSIVSIFSQHNDRIAVTQLLQKPDFPTGILYHQKHQKGIFF